MSTRSTAAPVAPRGGGRRWRACWSLLRRPPRAGRARHGDEPAVGPAAPADVGGRPRLGGSRRWWGSSAALTADARWPTTRSGTASAEYAALARAGWRSAWMAVELWLWRGRRWALPDHGRRRASPWAELMVRHDAAAPLLGEALLELLELVAERLGERVADAGVVLLELGQLGPPRLGVDATRARPSRRVVDVEAARCRWRPAPAPARSGVSTASPAPGDPLDDPLEHPAVLAEARATGTSRRRPCGTSSPRRAWGAGRRRARRSRASAGSSRPCCSRRTAASRRGRSGACRPRRPGRRWSPSS